jgi:hypothetical protein
MDQWVPTWGQPSGDYVSFGVLFGCQTVPGVRANQRLSLPGVKLQHGLNRLRLRPRHGGGRRMTGSRIVEVMQWMSDFELFLGSGGTAAGHTSVY